MPPESPTSLADLLGEGKLGVLSREAERRRGLTREIRAKLAPEDANHLVSASRNQAGELVLVMDSPAWATRVRYRAADLAMGAVRIKVLPGPAGQQ